MNTTDFTAANTIPLKLFKNRHVLNANGKIMPLHIQICPTNHCNRNCVYCECAKVDKAAELSIKEIEAIFKQFTAWGAKAVTITGGGEPTMHGNFHEILESAYQNGLKVGLVTNGDLLFKMKLDTSSMNKILTWCRISVNDKRLWNAGPSMEYLEKALPFVDIGMSHVVTKDTNAAAAAEFCSIVEKAGNNITHIRFVHDILDPNHIAMHAVECGCCRFNKAIFQYRDEYDHGKNPCYISRLKPLIDATGYIYPCCGVQYADKNQERFMPSNFKMCHWKDFDKIDYFDGSVCDRCYYNAYNSALKYIANPSKHVEFI